MSPARRGQRILGWVAVTVSAAIASLWAAWGIIENFVEGWYYGSLWMDLALMVAQYLLPMLLFVALSAVALLATLLVAGAEPALRVAGRIDDGNRGARRLEANSIDLVWAPEGPGWPRDGVDWKEAARRCRYLNADGNALADVPQDIWRLPSVEEAVRSQTRHGKNSGGVWDGARAKASYDRMPDKESPLWDVHSKIIYWWTATEAGAERAYVVCYNGTVRPRPRRVRWGYLAFRAVKAPEADTISGRP